MKTIIDYEFESNYDDKYLKSLYFVSYTMTILKELSFRVEKAFIPLFSVFFFLENFGQSSDSFIHLTILQCFVFFLCKQFLSNVFILCNSFFVVDEQQHSDYPCKQGSVGMARGICRTRWVHLIEWYLAILFIFWSSFELNISMQDISEINASLHSIVTYFFTRDYPHFISPKP